MKCLKTIGNTCIKITVEIVVNLRVIAHFNFIEN